MKHVQFGRHIDEEMYMRSSLKVSENSWDRRRSLVSCDAVAPNYVNRACVIRFSGNVTPL